MSERVLQRLLDEIEEGGEAVLVSVTSFRGSVPRKDHPRMLFLSDGTQAGTIGGGCVDGFARTLALKAFRSGGLIRDSLDLDGESADETALLCGGRLDCEAERFGPAGAERVRELLADREGMSPRLLIFGGGHVGQAAAELASGIGWRVSVLDDRASFVSEDRFPFAETRLVGDVDRANEWPAPSPNDAVLIATRGHAHDAEALAWAAGTDAGYIGMLSSERKRALVLKALAAGGTQTESLADRFHAPVGLSIGATSAEEIALAIAAQLLAFRRHAL